MSRAYDVSAKVTGVYGDAAQSDFLNRVQIFDIELNQFMANENYRSEVSLLVENNLERSLAMKDDSKTCYVLGRLNGRLGAGMAANKFGKSTALLGDYMHEVGVAGAGIAGVFDYILLGESIEELKYEE
ncbi:hypothetical protein [Paraferrimonas sp. SM1919]|uniref:hypothetical protein n=1 Tax=Paraferrimonas sp. SM1919 TaxID=2662263 RepID=UPI0013D03E75|nr:hypothetical protein [Paraferrimonas sp. SM1919]